MRRLLLLRHAKADRAEPGGGDETRPLTERGRADAARLGSYLTRHALTPDHAVVSTAARTRETWTHLSAAFKAMPAIEFKAGLYDASPEDILDAIRAAPPTAGALLVIGHNPGIQDIATQLVASGDIDARERLGEGFPTAAVAVIVFAADDWRSLHPHGGRLAHFVTPDWLASAD